MPLWLYLRCSSAFRGGLDGFLVGIVRIGEGDDSGILRYGTNIVLP